MSKKLTKNKILAIVALPPPTHGSNVMNEFVVNSKILNHEFEIVSLKYNFVEKVSQIGSFNIKKITKYLFILIKLIHLLINFKPNLVYFPIVPYGPSFLRDAFTVFIIRIF